MVREMAIDVEIVGLDPYGRRRRLSGMVGNRTLGPRHEWCEKRLEMVLERLRLFDRRRAAIGRQVASIPSAFARSISMSRAPLPAGSSSRTI